MKSRVQGIGVSLIACLMLSSCGLLPREEEYQLAPVVQEYESKQYTFATVGKEDVQRTKKISCVFSSAKDTPLSFGVSGVPVKSLMVSLGDTVQAGEVIAELDMENLLSERDTITYRLEQATLTQKHLKENQALEEKRLKILGESDSAMLTSYERQISQGEQEIVLLERKVATIKEMIAARQIVAPMTGSVSYIKNDLLTLESTQGETVIRLIGGDECYFVADRADVEGLTEGDSVDVTVGSTVYDTVLQYPAAEEEKEQVYLVIKSGEGQPEVGSKGSATLVLEERCNVLCLPNSAIKKVGEHSVVYAEDENGIRIMKYIEIGLVGNQKTEIISGLEFGENIIVR